MVWFNIVQNGSISNKKYSKIAPAGGQQALLVPGRQLP